MSELRDLITFWFFGAPHAKLKILSALCNLQFYIQKLWHFWQFSRLAKNELENLPFLRFSMSAREDLVAAWVSPPRRALIDDSYKKTKKSFNNLSHSLNNLEACNLFRVKMFQSATVYGYHYYVHLPEVNRQDYFGHGGWSSVVIFYFMIIWL